VWHWHWYEVYKVSDWNDQKVVIIGAARQGVALARYLAQHGAQVVLNDRRSLDALREARTLLEGLSTIRWQCGGHPLSLLDDADLVCVSGGVPLTLPLVVEAQARGIPLSNDSQIFMEAVPCSVIGITGSAGKTTTTTLVGRIAQSAANTPGSALVGKHVWVGGNIGSPLIVNLDQMQPDDLAVMELSSFQLEIMDRSPQVAAVLNITPNHLDRHLTMDAYTAAKAQILKFQSASDRAVLGRDDPGAWSLASQAQGDVFSFGFKELPENSPGAYLQDDAIYLRQYDPSKSDIRLMGTAEVSLRGDHNMLNVMAACTIAAAAGLPHQAMRAGIVGFTGVSHRLQFIRSWGGADWYNDSIATAPERAMAAIRSFDAPLVLMAGGRDKDLPWDEFARLVHRRVGHLIVFGEAAEIILDAIASVDIGESELTITRCPGLSDAVIAASKVVKPGDVVLLSPGGTSFDEFNDFEERGECFAQWVMNLP
jgi:UDP-N-acetylmuramoylalanine--D-glutamate ligase